jgi:hypothetical protein
VVVTGMGNQTLAVKNNIYTSLVRIDGLIPFPVTINEPSHSRVVVLSDRCNPLLQVYLTLPNGTTIYGQPQPINDQ